MIKNNYAIIGGYDQISSSIFEHLKITYKDSIFINVSGKIKTKNNFYNFKIFEFEKIIKCLKYHNVTYLCIVGKVNRPNLENIKIDKILDNYISDIISIYKNGDDQLMKFVRSIFINEGFKIVTIKKINPNLYFCSDILHNNVVSKQDFLDIEKGRKILNSLSKYDNAQSIIVSNGYILGIEAVEGTDKLIERVIIEKNILKLKKKEGFLIKIPKKNQIDSIDPPVIGPKTIRLASKCNLNGIAINRNKTVIFNKKKVVQLIKEKKIKIYMI